MTTFQTNDKIENSIKNNYIKATSDNEFKKLVNSLDVSEKEKIVNTSKLQDSIKELHNCKNCKGLNFCKNETNGYVFYPNVYNETLEFDYVACRYMKEKMKNDETKVTREKELDKASMKDVDYNDKSRIKLLKWITNFIKTYDNNKKCKGLYLHGDFGSGKTYIIAAALNELKKNGINSEIVHFSTLLRDLKANFDEMDGTISYLENIDILLLDDIGAEKVSEWGRDEILGTILQTRMNNYKTTFFTSNYDIEQLEKKLANGDEVAAARVIERIKVLTDDMELVGENRRK